ncbi:hypothetical protein [Robbsia andropogonis]|uniref:hypothetical protein n=1 Tax=Robbsia andropogonis TaxID=28092 RepID=UPI00209CB101|nr:hypothetical protein [Robbsia andropogonis]MCP1119616.1 hypothetical protein [Robbsia andropogonis]MCP1129599.1 hypothetical protein [Robbsia andropogonis]
MNSKIKIVLVEDWQHFWKWSSVRWQSGCAALIEILAWVAAHWPSLQPIFAQVFPHVSPEHWVIWGNLLQDTAPTQAQAHMAAGALMGGTFWRVTDFGRPSSQQ